VEGYGREGSGALDHPLSRQGKSLAHDRLRVAVEQLLGKQALPVAAALGAATAQIISRLEGPASRH